MVPADRSQPADVRGEYLSGQSARLSARDASHLSLRPASVARGDTGGPMKPPELLILRAMRRFIFIFVAASATIIAQTPGQPDWASLQPEVLKHFQTLVRFNTTDPPAGEEGNSRLGIQFMANQHFPEIDAEYCLAEGGNVTREAGKVKFASVQTLEKIPHGVELVARGPSGHASVPLKTNAVAHLAEAVAKAAQWRVPIKLNETTRVYFERLAAI